MRAAHASAQWGRISRLLGAEVWEDRQLTDAFSLSSSPREVLELAHGNAVGGVKIRLWLSDSEGCMPSSACPSLRSWTSWLAAWGGKAQRREAVERQPTSPWQRATLAQTLQVLCFQVFAQGSPLHTPATSTHLQALANAFSISAWQADQEPLLQ